MLALLFIHDRSARSRTACSLCNFTLGGSSMLLREYLIRYPAMNIIFSSRGLGITGVGAGILWIMSVEDGWIEGR